MDGNGSIRLLLVDDRTTEAAALGDRLAAEPDLAVLGALSGAEATPEALPDPAPDLLLVDHATLGRRGAAGLLAPLRAARPGLRALVLAHGDGDEAQLAAAAAGAVGCVPRALPPAELAEVARRVHAGGVLFRPRVLLQLLREGIAPPGRAAVRPVRPLLSLRERMALEAAAEGLTAAEAAARLVISRHTLRTHLRNAVGKLEARSTTHAVARAITLGLIDPHP